MTLPTELIKCVDKFTQYYESRTSHRKLKWIHTLGSFPLKADLDPQFKSLAAP